MEKYFFSNLGVDFKVLLSNSMGCLGHGSISPPQKKHVYWYQHFSIWGCFWCFFNAKTIIFMARVLVLNIKFSFHSISGLKFFLLQNNLEIWNGESINDLPKLRYDGEILETRWHKEFHKLDKDLGTQLASRRITIKKGEE